MSWSSRCSRFKSHTTLTNNHTDTSVQYTMQWRCRNAMHTRCSFEDQQLQIFATFAKKSMQGWQIHWDWSGAIIKIGSGRTPPRVCVCVCVFVCVSFVCVCVCFVCVCVFCVCFQHFHVLHNVLQTPHCTANSTMYCKLHNCTFGRSVG